MEVYKIGSPKSEMVKRIQQAIGLKPADGVFGPKTAAALMKWQGEHNLTKDGVAGPKTLAALFGNSSSALKKSKRRIDYLVVHCSDSPEGRNNTVDDIRRWHVKDRGWTDIGYNYVIHLDGSIHDGRDVDKIPSHCKNYNAHSIGICYVGGKTANMKENKDTRTAEQKESLLKLLCDLRQLYPKAKIVGHCNLDKKGKTCPNFDALNEYKNI